MIFWAMVNTVGDNSNSCSTISILLYENGKKKEENGEYLEIFPQTYHQGTYTRELTPFKRVQAPQGVLKRVLTFFPFTGLVILSHPFLS